MSQVPEAGGSRVSSRNWEKVNELRGQSLKVRRVRNETRGVSSRQGLDHWMEGYRGCLWVHLYPKSNRKSLVWFNWGWEAWERHTQIWVSRSLYVWKIVCRGNHSLPASTAPRYTLPGEGCCYLPLACWCQELPFMLLWPVPASALLAGPLHEYVNVPFSTPFHGPMHGAPITWFPGTRDNCLPSRMISSSTGDDSRARPTSS